MQNARHSGISSLAPLCSVAQFSFAFLPEERGSHLTGLKGHTGFGGGGGVSDIVTFLCKCTKLHTLN